MRPEARALAASFGLVLLGKMLLFPRFAHYGFFLALPASAALLVGGIGWLPSLIGVPRMHPLCLPTGRLCCRWRQLAGIEPGLFQDPKPALWLGC